MKKFFAPRQLHKFHQDERGMETIQVVMILAVSAVVLIFVKFGWEKISEWYTTQTDQVVGEEAGWATGQK